MTSDDHHTARSHSLHNISTTYRANDRACLCVLINVLAVLWCGR
jgi:hypothetical protein